MSAETSTLAGRMKIEALMIDTCRITRPGDGVPVFDEDTGQYTNPEPVVVYEGKCRIQVLADLVGDDAESGHG